jgi:molecular chaperone DnaK (HSP70)
MNCVKQTLKDANMLPRNIDEVVLVGGSTRIPKVQDLLSEFFADPNTFKPKKLCKSINPDEAVAHGAALQAALVNYYDQDTNSDDQDRSGSELDNMDCPDFVLLDVCPLSLGIETTGGLMTPLITRNTSIPVQKTKVFSTVDDYQKAVTISVFEGERSETKNNRLLGEFELAGITCDQRGIPQIEVKFEIDVDGIFIVSANDITPCKDGTNGPHKRLQINHTSRSAPKKDVEEMLKSAKTFEEQDRKFRELIRARNQLENLIYSIRDLITKDDRAKDNLSKKDIDTIEQRVYSEFEWIRSDEAREEQDKSVFNKKIDSLTAFTQSYVDKINQKIKEIGDN